MGATITVKGNKICPDCGQPVREHTETHLMECDRCLSKKDE